MWSTPVVFGAEVQCTRPLPWWFNMNGLGSGYLSLLDLGIMFMPQPIISCWRIPRYLNVWLSKDRGISRSHAARGHGGHPFTHCVPAHASRVHYAEEIGFFFFFIWCTVRFIRPMVSVRFCIQSPLTTPGTSIHRLKHA